MSALKHTPGPWHVETDGSPEHNNVANAIVGANGTLIVYGQINDADARLIAAAPDLLEALREMIAGDAEAIEEANALGVPFPDEMLATYRKAIAAIAKANGKAA